MTSYPKPETPLPWAKSSGNTDCFIGQDRDYANHAANAFPHLVAALTYVDAHWPSNIVREALAIARGEAKP